MKRVTAVYADGIGDGHFNTVYSYDANGNISTLSRKTDNVEIDALVYNYLNGNMLQSVEDAAENSEGYLDAGGTYLYDSNGNMYSDPSKGTTIDYNHDANGNIYSGNDKFVGQLTTALGDLRQGGPAGAGLVNDLMTSTNNTEVVSRGVNNADSQNGAYILWNPTGTNGGPDQNGGNTRPSFIGLGYEMAHVLRSSSR